MGVEQKNSLNLLDCRVVIMAGGKGSRLGDATAKTPKPMLPVAGKPVLEHQLQCLREQGIRAVTLVVGHLAKEIMAYFSDGSRMGMELTYMEEQQPLGSAGALYYLRDACSPLILINGDILFHVSLERMLSFHQTHSADLTLLTHPNSHPYDSALIQTDSENRVTSWITKEEPKKNVKNRVNAGIHIIEPRVLSMFQGQQEAQPKDLDRDIIKPNLHRLRVLAYDTPEYVKDMGTPDRYRQVCQDYVTGIVAQKCLSRKQRAVFLDRDGTLNQLAGFITDPEQLSLMEGAAEAVRSINLAGYLAILVTNQPVVARGDCTEEDLEQIHNRLEMLLGEQGAYLDAIYYCPHHPDGGFAGERAELKINCSCRKPMPGLIHRAEQRFNIDFARSYMIGDSARDVEAGHRAGCRTILLRGDGAKKEAFTVAPDQTVNSLKEAVEWILQHDHN